MSRPTRRDGTERLRAASAAGTRSASPFNKISLSTTSLSSLIPSFFDTNVNKSTPDLQANQMGKSQGMREHDNETEILLSDLLARESDVTVSASITSQAEYKGFAAYVISGTFLLIWLLWSSCPDSVLNHLGIYYYPSRWWALAVPSFILVTMGYVYVALACYNIEVETMPLSDPSTVCDNSGVIVTELSPIYRQPLQDENFLFQSTSGIWDLTLSDVNKVLYGEGRDDI